MKSAFSVSSHFLLSICLILSSSALPVIALAQNDTTLDAARAECARNSAAQWDAARNRCVGKEEARAERHAVEDCGAIADLEQRKECHKKIAENKTGLNADPNSLPEGSGGAGNMAMINAAYTMIGLINGLGQSRKESTCTSKKIFGITAMAGVATDIWLKIKAKEALDDLKNKYQVDVKNSAYDAQSKAFLYLKEEQQTVKDIAGREKTRNMLLMVGYGAASLMAIYEMTPYGENPDCYKKESNTKDQKTKCESGMSPGENGTCIGKVDPPAQVESKPLEKAQPEADPKPVDTKPPETVAVPPQKTEVTPPVTTTPKDQYVIEQRNGVTHIKSTDGTKTIVGDRIIDNKGTVIGRVDSSVEISRVGASAPVSPSDYRKYGVYSSSATNNASTINFTNSSSAGRTTVNGTTTTINDSRLRRGR